MHNRDEKQLNTKQKYEQVFAMIDDFELFKEERWRMQNYADRHIFKEELSEYGIEIEICNANGWNYSKLDDNVCIITCDGVLRGISYPDNGNQIFGRFMQIRFSTGPYVFGDDYPVLFFRRFFNELKDLGPEAIDSANNCLYFSMDKAGKVYESYKFILEKYREEYRVEGLRRELKKIQDNLAIRLAELPSDT